MTIRTPDDAEQNPNLVIFTGGVYNITVAFENQESEQSAVDGTIHRQVNYTRAVIQFGVRTRRLSSRLDSRISINEFYIDESRIRAVRIADAI